MVDEELREAATKVRQNAYAPYSDYKVGAALRDEQGRVFSGANFENASYGATICAERAAIGSMIAVGGRQIREVFVITENGGSPCGICLQVIGEFAAPETLIHLSDVLGRVRSFELRALAPTPFDLPEPVDGADPS